jgi:hypothetical protein
VANAIPGFRTRFDSKNYSLTWKKQFETSYRVDPGLLTHTLSGRENEIGFVLPVLLRIQLLPSRARHCIEARHDDVLAVFRREKLDLPIANFSVISSNFYFFKLMHLLAALATYNT